MAVSYKRLWKLLIDRDMKKKDLAEKSDNINKCYQCGKNRTAQVVKANDGFWGIDLERTSGPEAIWKNKQGMRASWRTNYEWLVENAETLYNGD